VNALEFLIDLAGRGVTFTTGDGGRVRVRDPENAITVDEREFLRALKPMVGALLRQPLPARRGANACDGFDAPAGAALCVRCAWGIGDHFWRRCGDCTFFVGSADEASCRRCGIPVLEHLGVAAS